MMTPGYAPIALFTFKRPAHTRRTLEALARNPEFELSPLHIFCDGARRPDEDAAVQATRAVARRWAHPHKTLHEAPANRGLAASIIDGVSRLCAAHGRVIVVEDDLVVSAVFLDFLNRALDRYADDASVMQVSGHMFPVNLDRSHSAAFLGLTTSWGWATWKRAWDYFSPRNEESARKVLSSLRQRYAFDFGGAYPFCRMLSEQMARKNDSWAIWWYLTVFSRNALCLFPAKSHVFNMGFDGTGTHAGVKPRAKTLSLPALIEEMPEEVSENSDVRRAVWRRLLRERGLAAYSKDTYFRLFPPSV